MLRLLLKVHEVHIRLREEVDVQIVIKKGTENFVIPRKAKLSQGKAVLEAHAEFFISSNEPVFDIFVMIIHGSGKRFAGMCQINLDDWEECSSNTTTSILQKSPDAQAKILFDFLFMTTDFTEPDRELVSLIQLESEKKLGLIKDAEEKNIFLTDENDRLTQELVALKKANKDLTSNQDLMTFEFTKKENEFESTMKQKCEEMESSENNLTIMKEKMLKLEAIVNNFGQADIKEKMKNLQNEYENQEKQEKKEKNN